MPALKKLLLCFIAVSTFVASRPVLPEADCVAEATRLPQSGKYEEAANSFGAILAANPQSAGALAGRTRALLKQHKVAEALEAAKAASASLAGIF